MKDFGKKRHKCENKADQMTKFLATKRAAVALLCGLPIIPFLIEKSHCYKDYK